MGVPFQAGLQFVLDAHQRFVRAGLPVYLRVANFTEPEEGAAFEVGVPFSPSGTNRTGFTDILIQPPPYVRAVSMHNIGIFGGRFDFGSKEFIISNTFVENQLQLDSFLEADVTDPYAVFRNRDGRRAIGIYYYSRLFSIEEILPREVSGATLSWKLICNAEENATTVSGGP